MLVALLVIQSFLTDNSWFERAALNTLFLGVVFSAIRTLSPSRIRTWVAVTVGIFAYILSWLVEVTSSTMFVIANHGCMTLVFSILLVALCDNVFSEGPVSQNRIIGAISIYFVLGLIWAFAYSILETLHPGSFAISWSGDTGSLSSETVSHFIYFSNVTLTTLGYGDIVPRSRPAQMFTTLEAITGQLYVAIVIARLVGLQISQGSSDTP